MKKYILTSILFLFISSIFALPNNKNSWENLLNKLQKLQSKEKKEEIIKSFLKINKGNFPLTYDNEVIFIYYGNADKVIIAGDFNGWKPVTPMKVIKDTCLWYYKSKFASDARFEYKFVAGNKWFLDPLNSKKALGGYGWNSDIWMPDYKPVKWLMQDKILKKGSVKTFAITSSILRNTRKLQVYTPFGYSKAKKYPLLIVHDGNDYLKIGKMGKILDILIAKKSICPVVAAFIDPVKRSQEYGCSKKYLAFTKKELVPFLEKNFSLTDQKNKRCFAGASMGGLVSFYLNYEMRDSFAASICQSGAFIFNQKDKEGRKISNFMTQIDYTKLNDSKIWMDCGNIGDLESYLLKGNRILQKKLHQAKIDYSYHELHEAHNWKNWQKRFKKALIYIYGIK